MGWYDLSQLAECHTKEKKQEGKCKCRSARGIKPYTEKGATAQEILECSGSLLLEQVGNLPKKQGTQGGSTMEAQESVHYKVIEKSMTTA